MDVTPHLTGIPIYLEAGAYFLLPNILANACEPTELEDEGMICISLHLVDFYAINVGKYTNPMDTMGYQLPETSELEHFRILQQQKTQGPFFHP